MPELPEVETVVRGLRRKGLVGCTVADARISWARTVGNMLPGVFRDTMAGRRIVAIRRRAKYLVLELAPQAVLLIHLRMTGRLAVEDAAVVRNPYERVALSFTDGRELRFRDTRKFGRWLLLEDAGPVLDRLGPEPLDATFEAPRLYAMLRRHRRMLKPLLLDQTFLAGLGNIYVDEALWEARLHPCRLSDSVTRVQAVRLHAAIRLVLQRGIAAMGTSLGKGDVNFYSVAGRRGRNQDQLRVFRRDGLPCPACGRNIIRLTVGQRSTHICTRCQRRQVARTSKTKR